MATRNQCVKAGEIYRVRTGSTIFEQCLLYSAYRKLVHQNKVEDGAELHPLFFDCVPVHNVVFKDEKSSVRQQVGDGEAL